MASAPDQHPLVRKLESITDLTPEERQALLDLPMKVQAIGADQDIVREGDRPSRCCLVLQGFVCRYKMTLPGKRQIMAFHISGDIPDLQSLHLTTLDHSLGTITPCEVGFIRHEDVRDLVRRFPRIGDAFWRDTLVDAAIFRAWMVGIGRREAYGRIAHLLCEVMVKLRAVGLADGQRCELPITQTELGDALGLSTVHVNRVLQELRGNDLITLRGGSLTVLDWGGLTNAGEFDPAYLHLDPKHLDRQQAA
jgi:CRP-like cAMP-binding protein